MLADQTARLVLGISLALSLPIFAAAAVDRDSDPTDAAQSVSLQPADADALRRKVLVQCGLNASTARNILPWYFHFAYAQALLEAGDARRAVPQFAQSIALKPEPSAHKRTYGMWFTDYLPYFQLAEAQAQLDNWPCAEHALRLSETHGEIALGRIEPQRIDALQARIDRHIDDAGECNLRDVGDPDYVPDATSD